ncbi:MAG TPA: imidazole glycerol phosphate synthase subunit HisH, partial [Acidimicrobiales bacterium]|nr:imidazole glycerol phosphate synthase subunit HisH [Acidimicrobiales bacterium]
MTASPRIAVLDYGIGNLRSAEKALQHVGAAARLVTDPADVAAADAVVLPGVGAFGACARALRESGLEGPARSALADGVPFFGVCIGFQLLYEGSVESPGAEGLGVFAGHVAALPAGVKHPQMQWNRLETPGSEGLEPVPLRGLGPRPWVYFVHSFAPPVGDETVAVCDYGGPVAALACRGFLWGAQFHPEKSG